MFAGDLVRALKGADVDVAQRVAILRGLEQPAISYQAPTSLLGSPGRTVPGLGIHPTTMRRIRGLIREWKPDIVQAHGGEPLKHLVVSNLGNIRVVYRRIGPAPRRVTHGLRRVAQTAVMKRASRIVAVGEAVRRETIQTFRVAADRVVAIPNGVDLERTRPVRGREETRRDLGIPSAAPVVTSVGALTWEKDPLDSIAVFDQVIGKAPQAIYLLVGDGPLREDVRDRVEALNLSGRVLTLGGRRDVPDILNASDVLLLTSRIEGMPASAIEAGIAAVPVVGYMVAGVPEIVIDGETGLLASAGDREDLAAKLRQLILDEEVRRAMGRAARERCCSLFDIQKIAPRYLELYQRVVENE
jgi:glycosyltransferase involved in cell wall biosynthesis